MHAKSLGYYQELLVNACCPPPRDTRRYLCQTPSAHWNGWCPSGHLGRRMLPSGLWDQGSRRWFGQRMAGKHNTTLLSDRNRHKDNHRHTRVDTRETQTKPGTQTQAKPDTDTQTKPATDMLGQTHNQPATEAVNQTASALEASALEASAL